MATSAEVGLPLSEHSDGEQLPSATFFLLMADEMFENAHSLLSQLNVFIELRADSKTTIGAPPTFVSTF